MSTATQTPPPSLATGPKSLATGPSSPVPRPPSQGSPSLPLDAIHQGDCVELLRRLESDSVDLAFADPPYNIGFKYDEYHDDHEDEVYLAWCERWMAELYRVVKPTGAFWLAIGDEYAAELKIAAKRLGFTARNWVVWYYTFGQNCRRKFNRSHAHLFHFIKDEELHTFNAADPALRIPSARALVYGDRRANLTGRLPDDTWIIPPAAGNAEVGMLNAESSADAMQSPADSQASRERVIPHSELRTPNSFVLRPQDLRQDDAAFHPQDDTWYFSRVAGTFKERQGFHGCQMPEQILGRIVRASSNAGELVLDPFSGSGTTLAVAKKLGRHWMGFELSTDYVKYASERIEGVTVGEPLSGPADPVRSAPTTAAGRRLKGHPMAEMGNAEGGSRKAESGPEPQPEIASPRERVIPQSAIPNPQSLRDLTRQAVVEAFHQSSGGASLDWLLCRPELQSAFHAACAEAGLMGSPYEWNRLLLMLRKAGALGKGDGGQGPGAREKQKGDGGRGTRESKPTSPHASSLKPHAAAYAAEIAWAKVRAKHAGSSLDDILCDPAKLELLDKFAKQAAPGREVSEYRWEALRLRKGAKTHKAEAKQYDYVAQKPLRTLLAEKPRKLTARAAKPLRGVGGVYLVTADRKVAAGLNGYVGAADDLGERLASHLGSVRGETYYAVVTDDALPSADYRDALRWNLVHQLRPTLSVDLLDEGATL